MMCVDGVQKEASVRAVRVPCQGGAPCTGPAREVPAPADLVPGNGHCGQHAVQPPGDHHLLQAAGRSAVDDQEVSAHNSPECRRDGEHSFTESQE